MADRHLVAAMHMLPDIFLNKLVDQLNNENTIGIMISGSFARGEGGPYSDVDLWQYMREIPASESEQLTLRFIDEYLVAIKLTTLEKEYAGMNNPEQAIWAIPGLRQACILLDKDGSIATLKEFAEKFTWEALQTSADAYVSWNLSGCTEEIFKILTGLAHQNESKTLYAVWGLTRELVNTLLIQRGMLIQTENVFIDLVQETAGRTSDWTRQFRLAVGLDLIPPEKPAYHGYGVASLRLYRETAKLLWNFLLPEDASIVTHTLALITEAGY